MRVVLAAMLLLGLLLSGCWDRHETNDLSIVVALGLDWQDGQYTATAEIINTKAVKTPGQGGGGGAPPDKPQSLLLTGHGTDPAAALGRLDNASSRRVFWPDLQVVVIGESLAKHGIGPVIATLMRYPQIPISARTLVSHGAAGALVGQREPGLETTVGRNLLLLAESGRLDQSSGYAPQIYDILRWEAEAGRAALVEAVQAVTPAQPTAPAFLLDHSAVLQDDRLVGWLPRDHVRMVLWMTGRFVRSNFQFACPGAPARVGSFRVSNAKGRVEPVITDGHLVAMEVSLDGRAGILHSSCPDASLADLQQAAAAAVQSEALDSIDWMEQNREDIVGLGEQIFRHAPKLWRQRIAANWPSVLRTLPVQLHVRLHLQYMGETRL